MRDSLLPQRRPKRPAFAGCRQRLDTVVGSPVLLGQFIDSQQRVEGLPI